MCFFFGSGVCNKMLICQYYLQGIFLWIQGWMWVFKYFIIKLRLLKYLVRCLLKRSYHMINVFIFSLSIYRFIVLQKTELEQCWWSKSLDFISMVYFITLRLKVFSLVSFRYLVRSTGEYWVLWCWMENSSCLEFLYNFIWLSIMRLKELLTYVCFIHDYFSRKEIRCTWFRMFSLTFILYHCGHLFFKLIRTGVLVSVFIYIKMWTTLLLKFM